MIKKILLSIIGLISLFFILAFVWLAFIFNLNDYKAWLNNKINHDPNLHIILNGKLDFSLRTMKIHAEDILINAQNETFKSHWQNAIITINPLDFFTRSNSTLKSLELQNGNITTGSGQNFKVTEVKIVEKNQHYDTKAKLMNNLQTINIQFTFTPSPDATEFHDLSLWAKLNELPLYLKIPKIYLSNHGDIDNIENIHLKINDQSLTGNLSNIKLKPEISIDGSFFAPQIALTQILNLNGFKLNLNEFKLNFTVQQNTPSLTAKLNISAANAKLIGIDLNTLGSSIHKLLAAVEHGDGIGSAFQTLKSQLLPLLTKNQPTADLSKSTQLQKLNIQNTFNNQQLQTTLLTWNAQEFTITGQGQIDLTQHSLSYPLNIHIKGMPSLAVPYTLGYRNGQFTAAINQERLQKNLQPIIEKALSNALNNKLGSFFR